ncbi:acyl-[acyl-carrier-protein] thioesterase [Promethearchaeum syntrophicum]|uniref:Acyl-[acyl-carrier-protein] thioesterase n=1 Tax=Promethearchaeum syntrophicum TaxID=2594042 RepID=A0A5B9DEV7_9ARCH|nr:acyl-ACP thioesterase domain-containing protein [Candidatus Prometheoarchaeum syntrophicum]QEE17575.1 Acyl-ACP thioesterase [Candidatus Prometheoarchaeum syntrophicum]
MDQQDSIFIQKFPVRYGDIDISGYASIKSFFSNFQEIGFNHADILAQKYNGKKEFSFAVVWTKLNVVMKRIPKWKEMLTYSSWISPLIQNSKIATRNFKIEDSQHNQIGYGYGTMVFFDMVKRKSIEIPKELLIYPTHDYSIGNHEFSKLDNLSTYDYQITIKTQYTDLDIYRHVNNVRYINWVIDSMPLDILKKKKCYETEIHFLNEAKNGILVKSNTKILTENEKISANHEIIREDGKSIARVKTIWK